jgi:2-polyprenyl-6-methoxyphenol hydroxylase-like FAD-dependent oxidoreductase
VLADRRAASRAARSFTAFVEDLARWGVLAAPPASVSPVLGGWLKMGIAGTVPARGRVLLAGDAAGLVNPLQGEGIAQAMASGRAAAEAVLRGSGDPAPAYRAFLARTYRPYHAVTAPVHGALLPRPRLVSVAGRVLTAPGVGRAVAGGWSIYWNDLLDGARPGRGRAVAALADGVGRILMRPGRTRRWFSRYVA